MAYLSRKTFSGGILLAVALLTDFADPVAARSAAGTTIIPAQISGVKLTPLGSHSENFPDEIAWNSNQEIICGATNHSGNYRLAVVNVVTGKLRYLSAPNRTMTRLFGDPLLDRTVEYQCKVSPDGRKILVWGYILTTESGSKIALKRFGSTFMLSVDGKRIRRVSLVTLGKHKQLKEGTFPYLVWLGDSRHWVEVNYPTSVLHDGDRKDTQIFKTTGIDWWVEVNKYPDRNGLGIGSVRWTMGDILVLPLSVDSEPKSSKPFPIYLLDVGRKTVYESSLTWPAAFHPAAKDFGRDDTEYDPDFYLSPDRRKIAWTVRKTRDYNVSDGQISALMVDHKYDIYVSRIDSTQMRLVMHGDFFGNNLAWSPDGKRIAILMNRIDPKEPIIKVVTVTP